jgi:glycosyltransferase involved in cell wall biosynthesis
MYKISYVLPVYNCQSTIVDCLESLKKQIVKGEIIVIDDGSTDKTLEILDLYKNLGVIDHIIPNKDRRGAAYSRNAGNALASGDIIAVCDVDHYYKYRGEAIVEFFKKNPDKDIFYTASHLRQKNNILEKSVNDAVEWDFKSKCPISHPTVAYRKKVVESVKYKELSRDTDLYEFFLLDAKEKGFKFGGTQHPSMVKVEGNSIRDVSEAKKLKKKLYSDYGISVN